LTLFLKSDRSIDFEKSTLKIEFPHPCSALAGLYEPKGGRMRRYETFLIVDPDLTKSQREPMIDRVKELISQMNGFWIQADEWGDRKLAYAIKKKARGYYVRFDYCGAGSLVNEIERFFRIDERALKYMTVLLDESADIEKIKEEIAAAQSQSTVTSETETVAEVSVEAPPAEAVAAETEPMKAQEEA
jgi:small subunit ribosomal protein S6